MGLEDLVDVTDDIGAADAILASSFEIRQNPWIRSVAKFHKLPIFVIKVIFGCLFSCYFDVFSLCYNELLVTIEHYHVIMAWWWLFVIIFLY